LITREFDLTIRVPQQDYNDTGIKLVQNDQNVYYFNIRITDGINDIDYSQVERATITFKKRGGNVVQGNLEPTGNGYRYMLGTNEIACPGKVIASIQLYGALDERLTTARFAFEVIQDLINPSMVESTTEFDALTKAIVMMEELEERLEDFPNIKVLGTYPTLADLLAAHPDGSGLDGGYFVVENGEFYIWSTVTNQWESLGTIKGPKGDQGPQGEQGPKGDKPAHEWQGTSLRFENPDGSWGQFVNLKGQDGTGAGDMLKSTYDTDDDGKVDAADNADKLGGIAASLYALLTNLTNKNLLHNWDFRNPVNQRGFTSTTNAEYTIDRWRSMTSGHTVELTPNGLKLTASSEAEFNYCIAQYIENYKQFEGKTLTLSVHVVENTLTQGCCLCWNDTAGSRITGTGLFSFTFTPSSLSSLGVGIQFWDRVADSGKYVVIDKMKLEIGSTSTLANDPPADYGEQLALCQRYYQKINILRPLCSCHSTRIEFMVPLSVPLRSVPTIESYSVPAWFRVDGNHYVGSDYIAASNAASVLDSNYNIFTSAITIMFSLSPEISAITNKLGYASHFTTALSADL